MGSIIETLVEVHLIIRTCVLFLQQDSSWTPADALETVVETKSNYSAMNWTSKLCWSSLTLTETTLQMLGCSALLLFFLVMRPWDCPVRPLVCNTHQSRCPHLADRFPLNRSEWFYCFFFSPAVISHEFNLSLCVLKVQTFVFMFLLFFLQCLS